MIIELEVKTYLQLVLDNEAKEVYYKLFEVLSNDIKDKKRVREMQVMAFDEVILIHDADITDFVTMFAEAKALSQKSGFKNNYHEYVEFIDSILANTGENLDIG